MKNHSTISITNPTLSSPEKSESSVNLFQRKAAGILMKLRPEFLASFIKKSLRFRRTNITTNDGTFFVDISSCLGYQLFKNGVYESGMRAVLKTYLRPGNICVELGANEGYFTAIASNLVGKEGKIIAVEPQERLQPILRENLRLNNCENVTILSVAVSDKSETVTLYISPDMNTGSTGATKISRFSQPKQETIALTLTELFDQQAIATCDLLKIDIEGFEYEAILGSKELFETHRVKAIALELHPVHLAKRGLSEQDIVDFLASCDYQRKMLEDNLVYLSPDYE
ncbi:MAG: FkbM family methyltransferase [Oscillatoria sp. PMC 1051.18]|nr:FkbM family methyltransferase [Oscillatoria sp. PMC 1050.18]MEC5028851.1 FkbM family methyltransferase [Oscillatoria sp. PMC 1051.18]